MHSELVKATLERAGHPFQLSTYKTKGLFIDLFPGNQFISLLSIILRLLDQNPVQKNKFFNFNDNLKIIANKFNARNYKVDNNISCSLCEDQK